MALSLRCSLIVLAVTLFAVVQTVQSADLECYKCDNSDPKSTKCKETAADGDALETCKGDGQKCLKIRDANSTVIFRGCNTQFYCDNYAKCDSCTTAKCNSSSGLLPSFLLIGVVSAILSKYYL